MFDTIKFVGSPGSIPFLVLAVIVGLVLVTYTRRLFWTGVVWLSVVVVGYLALALPAVAMAIASALPAVVSTGSNARPMPATVEILIVLDGDNRRGRVREVQRVLREHAPSTVWVLGERWMIEALAEAGVAKPGFRYDASAGTTREQMDQVETIARAARGRTAVIASRLQVPRVAALASRRNLAIHILPSSIDDEPPLSGALAYVPAFTALRVSRDAFYEHVALAYYRWRGWIG